MLIDLDELSRLDRALTFFKWNRRGLFSFHDCDHGDGRPLKDWIDSLLDAGGFAADGPRRVLCYPRIFGYVFNPLSVWFCHDAADKLKAVIYEVHNTYNERHAYVFGADGEKLVRHNCAKKFYVSPFLSPDCHYHFRVHPPDGKVGIAIHEEESGMAILNASFAGRRHDLNDRALLRMLLSYPLMTLKVFAAIHFEAVRLMLKGVQRHQHS